jgi:hypothetical protein
VLGLVVGHWAKPDVGVVLFWVNLIGYPLM